MATVYELELTRTQGAKLRAQVTTAIAHAAIYVLGGGSQYNRNHETHAENANRNPASYIDYFIWDVLRDATVAAAHASVADSQTDAQVQAVVDAKWPRAWK